MCLRSAGLFREVKGKLFRPVWKDKCLVFSYEGGDKIRRSLAVHFYPLPAEIKGNTVQFHISLKPNEIRQIRISLAIAESEEQPNRLFAQTSVYRDLQAVSQGIKASAEHWLKRETEFRSDSLLLNRVMRRSLMDLHMLKTSIGGDEFFAAGVPWFVALFGRDCSDHLPADDGVLVRHAGADAPFARPPSGHAGERLARRAAGQDPA